MQRMMHDTIEKNVSLMYSDEFLPPLTNKVLFIVMYLKYVCPTKPECFMYNHSVIY